MSTEPMITIKQADGTFTKVPLSELPTKQQTTTPAPAPQTADQPDAPIDMGTEATMPEGDAPSTVADTTVETDLPPTTPDTPLETEVASPLVEDVVDEEKTEVTTETETTSIQEEMESDVTTSEASDTSLVVQPEILPAVEVPNTQVFEHAWDDDDHRSLLEEDIHSDELQTLHEKRGGDIPVVSSATGVEGASVLPRARAMSSAGMAMPKVIPIADVTPPAPAPNIAGESVSQTMNPIEELRTMTLDDFRRLGGRTVVGEKELKQKFQTLLDESILVYLDAVRAWYASPIYKQYLMLLSNSVKNHESVQSLCIGGDSFTQEECNALVALHQAIRL